MNLAAIGAAAAQSAADYKAHGLRLPVRRQRLRQHGRCPTTRRATRPTRQSARRSPIAREPAATRCVAARGRAAGTAASSRCAPRARARSPAIFNAGRAGGARSTSARWSQPTTQGAATPRRLGAAAAQAVLAQRPAVDLAGQRAPRARTFGWGGRIGDLFASGNANADLHLHVGHRQRGLPLRARPRSSTRCRQPARCALDGDRRRRCSARRARSALLRALITAAADAPVRARATPRMTRRSIDADGAARPRRWPRVAPLATAVAGRRTASAEQLQMVARIIAARDALGVRRQVFFVCARRLRHPRLPADDQPSARC